MPHHPYRRLSWSPALDRAPQPLRALPRPALDAFRPELRYILLDLQAWKKDEIIGGLLLRVTLLVLQAIFRPGLPRNLTTIAGLLRGLTDQVVRERELRRMLAYAANAGPGLSVAEVAGMAEAATTKEGETMALTLAAKLRAEGRADGLAEGLIGAIEDALQVRFSDAGLSLMSQIRQIASPTSLKGILRTIHRASDIDEVRRSLQQYAGDPVQPE